MRELSTRIVPQGNIVTLGGVSEDSGNGLEIVPAARCAQNGNIMELPERHPEGGIEDCGRFHPGFPHLLPDGGLVVSCMVRGPDLVWNNRSAKHSPVDFRRRRTQTVSSSQVGQLYQLEQDERFAALHRPFGSPARICPENAYPRPLLRDHHLHRPGTALYSHGDRQWDLYLQPQQVAWTSKGGRHGQPAFPNSSVDSARLFPEPVRRERLWAPLA